MSIDNKLEDPGRRKFFGLMGKVASLAAAYPVVSAAESMLGVNSAEAAERYSDSDYLRMMNQPVEETLKGTNVVYVDDSNYQKEVFGSDKPVMVLFYSNHKDAVGSPGLGTLARVLSEQFPEIKFAAYEVKNVKESGKIGYSDFVKLQGKYPVKDLPALLFYDNDNGKIELLGQSGGVKSLGEVKSRIDKYSNIIPPNMLD